MNMHLWIIHHPLTHQIGWALLHSLWEGALIGAGFVVARFALRRRSANARYLAGCVSLTLLLAAPVLTAVLGAGHSAASATGTVASSGASAVAAPVFEPAGFGNAYAAPSAATFGDWGLGWLGQVAPLLTVVWLIGVGFFSARLTRSCWQVRGMRIRDNELADAAWLATLRDLQRRLGVSRPVRLLKSGLVEVPTVLGWLRPVILLPAATLGGLTPSQLEAILAHELAHVRRLDYVFNAFQCVVETLMFYHPVAWWISRCIREERENACDDLVVEVCGDRLGYARALATLEGYRAGLPELAFAANGGSLLNRLRRLLGVSRESGRVTFREVSGLALLGIGLVLILLGVRMLLTVPSYRSTARFRIERDQTDIPGLADQRSVTTYDPYFIQTEFEVLQSETVLGKVVEQLDLNREWGKKYASGEKLKTSESIVLLKGRMELRVVRNTSLIEIRVYDWKPEEAARIANAIAEAYCAFRHERLTQMQRSGVKALEDRFAEQEAKVREAQRKVEELRAKLNISDAAASAEGPAPMMTADTLRQLERSRIESKAEYVRQLTLLDRLKILGQDPGPGSLAQALSTAVPDTVLAGLQDRLTSAELQLVAARKAFDPEHTEVVKAKAIIEDLHKRIKERVEGVMLGLEARVLSLSNSLVNLQLEVGRATTNDLEQANTTRPYFAAKAEVEELKRFRQILDAKIAYEKVEVNLPGTRMVQIVDKAVPWSRPVSPDPARAAALIVLGVLLDLLGLFLLTGRPGSRSEASPA
jgi:beta-lactamase regulating signal transducer with metallopeptidase domain/uncharacterized protein involved in exopolysaccharide biosynthesis